MKKLNKLSIAILAASASTFVSAVDLGEVNGTKFSVGGYLKAETIWGMPDAGSNSVEGSARQSRFNLKATKEVDGHKLGGFIEGDFWGSAGSAYAWRLRHAYISIDSLTVGQTWSGNFFATAPFDVRMINFFGPGWGSIAGIGAHVRPDFVAHYRTNGFTISAAEPLYSEAEMPDMVVSYAQRFKSGSGYSVAVTAREAQSDVADPTASKVGAAFSFQGKLAVGKGAITAGAFTGKAQGPNTGMCNGGAYNPTLIASCDADGGDLISQTGFSVGVTQDLNEKLNGTLRYGKTMVDDAADSSGAMTTATLMYKYAPGLDLGIEWRDQNMQNHPLRPDGQQIEVMAMYKF